MEEKVQSSTKEKKTNYKIRVILVLLFIVLFALYSFISYRGEYLQIKEIGQNYLDVFHQNMKFKYNITGINFLIWFLAIYITNKFIKSGLKQFFNEEKKQMPKLPNKSIALIFGTIIAIITSNMLINKTILFLNNASFEMFDPIFGQDIGYYIFQKPFIEMILLYITEMMVGLAIYTGVYYIIVFNVYFDGVDAKTLKDSKFIKQLTVYAVIIAICISGITLLKTEDILFENFITLDDSNATELTGAGFTDVTIKLWGYRIFALLILVSILLTIRRIRKGEYKKAVKSILGIPVYLVILFAVTSITQLVFVSPNVLDKEKTYIGYNIQNTKDAYNINIDEVEIENGGMIASTDIENYQNVIDNIPIVSKDMTLKTLAEYKDSVGYYSYNRTKIQSYNIYGKQSLVYVSPREILIDGVNRTYDNKTYNYTHGYGSIITYSSKTDERGNVLYLQDDFNSNEETIPISEKRIYFGMETNSDIIVNAKNKTEFDYPTSTSTNTENTYNGKAGLQLGFWDRVALGLSTNNIDFIFSGNITNKSKIIVNRNIIERAKKIMPYLSYDEEPYLVITEDGKQVWVLDAYTTSSSYPYSQYSNIEINNTRTKINYIRNSVKVLIDSYDGTIKFYITDRTDPIAMAYRNIYPGLFVDFEENIPQDISNHFVYPQFLYNIQAKMYERYHKIQTEVLYRNDDVWEVAKANTTKSTTGTGKYMESYYTMLKLPDSENEQLGLVIPYTSYGKQNIISYLVGWYEGNQMKLRLYKFNSEENILSPAQLDKQLEEDETISTALETLNTPGSKIIKEMIVVPINNTLLYVEPIYQVYTNESLVPIIKKIVVSSGNKVAIGDDLEEALENLLSKSAVNIEIESTDTQEGLIDAIIKANKNLEESSNNSDWEMMGKDIKRLQELIEMLEQLNKQTPKQNNIITNDVVTTNTIANSIN